MASSSGYEMQLDIPVKPIMNSLDNNPTIEKPEHQNTNVDVIEITSDNDDDDEGGDNVDDDDDDNDDSLDDNDYQSSSGCSVIDITKPPITHNVYGAIDDVSVGDWWLTSRECWQAGVHRPPATGAPLHCGPQGAYSVTLSNLCSNSGDVDGGERFTLSTGGTVAEPSPGDGTTQQSLSYDTVTLVASMKSRKPVRVVRSHKLASAYAPDIGYRYDGLYAVDNYWVATSKEGATVYKFLLQRLGSHSGQAPPPWLVHKIVPPSLHRAVQVKYAQALKVTSAQDILNTSSRTCDSIKNRQKEATKRRKSMSDDQLMKQPKNSINSSDQLKPSHNQLLQKQIQQYNCSNQSQIHNNNCKDQLSPQRKSPISSYEQLVQKQKQIFNRDQTQENQLLHQLKSYNSYSDQLSPQHKQGESKIQQLLLQQKHHSSHRDQLISPKQLSPKLFEVEDESSLTSNSSTLRMQSSPSTSRSPQPQSSITSSATKKPNIQRLFENYPFEMSQQQQQTFSQQRQKQKKLQKMQQELLLQLQRQQHQQVLQQQKLQQQKLNLVRNQQLTPEPDPADCFLDDDPSYLGWKQKMFEEKVAQGQTVVSCFEDEFRRVCNELCNDLPTIEGSLDVDAQHAAEDQESYNKLLMLSRAARLPQFSEIKTGGARCDDGRQSTDAASRALQENDGGDSYNRQSTGSAIRALREKDVGDSYNRQSTGSAGRALQRKDGGDSYNRQSTGSASKVMQRKDGGDSYNRQSTGSASRALQRKDGGDSYNRQSTGSASRTLQEKDGESYNSQTKVSASRNRLMRDEKGRFKQGNTYNQLKSYKRHSTGNAEVVKNEKGGNTNGRHSTGSVSSSRAMQSAKGGHSDGLNSGKMMPNEADYSRMMQDGASNGGDRMLRNNSCGRMPQGSAANTVQIGCGRVLQKNNKTVVQNNNNNNNNNNNLKMKGVSYSRLRQGSANSRKLLQNSIDRLSQNAVKNVGGKALRRGKCGQTNSHTSVIRRMNPSRKNSQDSENSQNSESSFRVPQRRVYGRKLVTVYDDTDDFVKLIRNCATQPANKRIKLDGCDTEAGVNRRKRRAAPQRVLVTNSVKNSSILEHQPTTMLGGSFKSANDFLNSLLGCAVPASDKVSEEEEKMEVVEEVEEENKKENKVEEVVIKDAFSGFTEQDLTVSKKISTCFMEFLFKFWGDMSDDNQWMGWGMVHRRSIIVNGFLIEQVQRDCERLRSEKEGIENENWEKENVEKGNEYWEKERGEELSVNENGEEVEKMSCDDEVGVEEKSEKVEKECCGDFFETKTKDQNKRNSDEQITTEKKEKVDDESSGGPSEKLKMGGTENCEKVESEDLGGTMKNEKVQEQCSREMDETENPTKVRKVSSEEFGVTEKSESVYKESIKLLGETDRSERNEKRSSDGLGVTKENEEKYTNVVKNVMLFDSD